MDNRDEVKVFLSSRRAKITPEQAGLQHFNRNRRVPGLRRSEVADLAGVSVEYYAQLERGLREMRRSSAITARALSALVGKHHTSISKIENGVKQPTESDVIAWCRACGAEDQTADLLATLRAIETAYIEWKRSTRAGLRRLGNLHSATSYDATAVFRIHEPTVLPGFLQTEQYIRDAMGFWYDFLDVPNDIDEVVAISDMKSCGSAVRYEVAFRSITRSTLSMRGRRFRRTVRRSPAADPERAARSRWRSAATSRRRRGGRVAHSCPDGVDGEALIDLGFRSPRGQWRSPRPLNLFAAAPVPGMLIGYGRVATRVQNLARQQAAL